MHFGGFFKHFFFFCVPFVDINILILHLHQIGTEEGERWQENYSVQIIHFSDRQSAKSCFEECHKSCPTEPGEWDCFVVDIVKELPESGL